MEFGYPAYCARIFAHKINYKRDSLNRSSYEEELNGKTISFSSRRRSFRRFYMVGYSNYF